MEPIEAVLVGAGQRGREAIGAFAQRHPDELKFIAVVEPDKAKRNGFAKIHNISKENCFSSYEEFFKHPKIAPLCFNTTMDKLHFPSAMLALEKEYHLFLEKPMTDNPKSCLILAEEAKRRGLMIQICHPLRYTTFYSKIKELIDKKTIGNIISFSMNENVAYWHFAHSFVRGNWGKLENSGPFILTKCCHDMDIATWIANSKVKKVFSAGELQYFCQENAPPNSPMQCTDGCPIEKTCPFYAPAIYLTDYTDWPVSAISFDRSFEARKKAVQKGPYGKCVFKCNNNVVDNQVVCAEFENGITFNFAVYANSFYPFRTIRIIGTTGEINAHFEKMEIKILRFGQGMGDWGGNSPQPEIIYADKIDGAHGGGDTGVIRNFLKQYRENNLQSIEHSLDIAVEGHLLAFAAEHARISEKVIFMQDYKIEIMS